MFDFSVKKYKRNTD